MSTDIKIFGLAPALSLVSKYPLSSVKDIIELLEHMSGQIMTCYDEKDTYDTAVFEHVAPTCRDQLRDLFPFLNSLRVSFQKHCLPEVESTPQYADMIINSWLTATMARLPKKLEKFKTGLPVPKNSTWLASETIESVPLKMALN